MIDQLAAQIQSASDTLRARIKDGMLDEPQSSLAVEIAGICVFLRRMELLVSEIRGARAADNFPRYADAEEDEAIIEGNRVEGIVSLGGATRPALTLIQGGRA